MLNVGPQEILLILVVALVIVGPHRLPDLARTIGKGLRSLRVAQDEVRRTVSEVLEPQEFTEATSEIRRTGREIREGLRDVGRPDGAPRKGREGPGTPGDPPAAGEAGGPPPEPTGEPTGEPPAEAAE